MIHLDEGRLQAFLDEELNSRDRAAAAQHVLQCEACRETMDDLKDAAAVVTDAVAALDSQPTPLREAPTVRRKAGWSLARAAVLVLLAAAAGSAAVPGSPLRGWIGQAAPGEATPRTETPEETTAPAREPADPAGISVTPGPGVFEVALNDLDGMVIRLRQSSGRAVSVSAVGADVDPRYRLEAGRLEASGGRGGAIVVELPVHLTAGRLLVDGRVYAEKVGGELRLRVAGDRAEADIVWP